MKLHRHQLVLLAGGLLGSALATHTSTAEQIWVKSESAEIRSGKGAVFPLVATAAKGAELTVISREPKGWIKVKSGEVEGYVYENSIAAQKVDASGNLFSAMGAGVDASKTTSGAAAKGLQPDADVYARGQHLSTAPLNKLIAARNKLDPKEWQAFTAEGKVGPDAP